MHEDYSRVSVTDVLKEQGEALGMTVLTGEAGLGRYIDHPRVEKPSLAFAGYLEKLNDYRLQVVGKSELGYLATRPEAERKKAVDAVFDLRLAAVVITYGMHVPDIVLEAAKRTDTPLISTPLDSQTFMTNMMLYLSRRLAPRTFQHGVYMDIFGLGVLLTGGSGIGKSEIALELVSRGHRLIADDMVELSRVGTDVLVGRSPEALKYHMEIRGIGILNIRDLFGAAAITDAKRVGLVLEIVHWDDMSEQIRLLGEDASIVLHDVKIPKALLPVRPGRSLAVLVEVAARNQLLKQRGIESGKAFMLELENRIQQGQG
ncbi:MAG: HPr(Ser) kinase/phosphatase [Zetaproteobacteria bacterium CG12_big_fil_rev_8_21_14_0_65_55_1124]|nr:MAG: HPr(Ser) kinase/phosphatase [Zetaproteobacteria bacterium CG1_02_55_237]PIS19553.1 MAG: HPr(Ser) kinase/phosphatase [Zetaproteobacteria bacterium CG08_land_8_20_14_0_20_55_17]PIW42346.1 MAG: HPr(Ser) kinase/phosphatase [Zetaproteobacteria bacterium CG12_big_fil_rev_8_21_14_0_65_55_1124]PIY52853.1 MAG: HPr(Ser) kinase/phosphatase [Zetaproteobacteria bacterium CG_4_10_14_0_8_um_filter_55_43]PIZ38059.1 MAG: HPr(Ser) kinase/phosphatase [Zetaproteobacteria bacterium CG_4_10_14_0_2_um_filter_